MPQQVIDYAKLAADLGGQSAAVPPPTGGRMGGPGPGAPPMSTFGGLQVQSGPVDYGALAQEFGGRAGEMTPDGRLVFKSETSVNLPKEAKDFAASLWQHINPIEFVKFVGEATRHPIQTGRAVLQGQGQLLTDAKAEYARGDYPQAARKFINYLLPVLGQGIDAAAESLERGDYGKGLGASVGMGVNLGLPSVVANARTARPILKNQNPQVAAAVEQGQQAGVPIDLATASGNTFVQNTQKLLGQTAGGSLVGGRAFRRQAEGLERHGRQLADEVSPAPMTPETAGASAIGALEGRVTQFSRDADQAYSALRAMEAQAPPTPIVQTVQGRVAGGGSISIPQTASMRLAVDVKAAKNELRPLYDDLMRQSELVPLQGAKARVLVALDRLLNGKKGMHGQVVAASPDFAPLSVVDQALSELKALNRSNEAMATSGAHAISSQAVKALDRQVVLTARNAGPDVLKALLDGRKATVAKYVANDVLESLAGRSGEPVGAFRAATQSGDAAIKRLRQVARETPDQMPVIGRAVLDDLFQKATAEGGFGRTDALWRDWQALGPETKRLLFSKPGQVQALDNFFLLAKKINENPNKSGSALTLVSATEMGSMGAALGTGNIGLVATQAGFALTAAGLTKAMYSPTIVRLLTKGMTIPPRGPAAVAWANAFTKAARAEGVELVPIPAGAEGQSTSR